MEKLIYSIPLLPLIGFLINGLLGKQLPKKVVGSLATLAVATAFVLALQVFMQTTHDSAPVVVTLFKWFSIQNISVDFAFQIDQLSIMMVMIITGIGTLIHLYSMGYMSHDEGYFKFFTYLNLFIFSMLLLVMGSNYLILFIGWEGVGLCSFLLIGFWYHNKDYVKAAKKAFIMNRIGDLGLLLGIFCIAYQFGSIDFIYLSTQTDAITPNSTIIIFITMSLFVGAMGKSAQIPLFTWLPDAMAGPTPVSALIHAATMVTAGIYMVVRSNFFYSLAPDSLDVILYIGLATSLVAAFIGLRQNDIKKVLAYSTVSQLGFMFVALGAEAYTTAMFHLMTHAFFKALLFLGSGSVIHAMGGEQDMRFMGGLKKYIPITFITFAIGTLAICGIPPLSGMVSKDEILTVLWVKSPIIWGLAIFSAMLTAIYMFRMFFLTFYGKFRGTEEQKHHLHESPASMTIPLVVLAVLTVVGGAFNLPHFVSETSSQQLSHWLEAVYVFDVKEFHVEFGVEMILMALTIVMVLVVMFITKKIFSNPNYVLVDEKEFTGWERLSTRKLFLDEIYNASIAKPVLGMGKAGKLFEKHILDNVVKLISSSVTGLGKLLKKLQNGHVESYMIIMALAAGLIIIVKLYKII
jgi:NADH-quinone oxidoreductase subunit L